MSEVGGERKSNREEAATAAAEKVDNGRCRWTLCNSLLSWLLLLPPSQSMSLHQRASLPLPLPLPFFLPIPWLLLPPTPPPWIQSTATTHPANASSAANVAASASVAIAFPPHHHQNCCHRHHSKVHPGCVVLVVGVNTLLLASALTSVCHCHNLPSPSLFPPPVSLLPLLLLLHIPVVSSSLLLSMQCWRCFHRCHFRCHCFLQK